MAVEPDGRDGCGGCGELCDAVGVAAEFYADEGSAGVLCGVEVLVGFLNPVQCCVGRWRPCSEGLGFMVFDAPWLL